MTTHLISRIAISLLAGIAVCTSVSASEYRSGDIVVLQAVARATVPHQPAGAAYLAIENLGKHSDKLIGASTKIAKSTQIHTMSMSGNVMRMREVGSIELKPAEKVTMQPGDGYHLMLLGLKQPLKLGEQFPLLLSFEKAGKLEIMVKIEEVSANHDSKHGARKH